jgi:hypothetical protein
VAAIAAESGHLGTMSRVVKNENIAFLCIRNQPFEPFENGSLSCSRIRKDLHCRRSCRNNAQNTEGVSHVTDIAHTAAQIRAACTGRSTIINPNKKVTFCHKIFSSNSIESTDFQAQRATTLRQNNSPQPLAAGRD